MSIDKVNKAIKAMSETDDEVYSIACTIKDGSVDTAKKICDCAPIDGSADLLEVRLMADNKTGFLIIPKDGSIVIVTMTNKFTGYVAMFSEVEEIQLNGKTNGGLIKIDDLITKLNNLENAYNSFVSVYNSHIHLGVDSITSAPVTVPPTPNQQGTVLTPTVKSSLENIKVLHGS